MHIYRYIYIYQAIHVCINKHLIYMYALWLPTFFDVPCESRPSRQNRLATGSLN